MDWITAVAAGIKAKQEEPPDLWTLGDLALAIEPFYGQEGLLTFAYMLGISNDMLKTYLSVASAYDKKDRLSRLSWTHHRALAAEPDRLEILAAAEAAGIPDDLLPAMVKMKRVRERLEEASRILKRLKEEETDR